MPRRSGSHPSNLICPLSFPGHSTKTSWGTTCHGWWHATSYKERSPSYRPLRGNRSIEFLLLTRWVASLHSLCASVVGLQLLFCSAWVLCLRSVRFVSSDWSWCDSLLSLRIGNSHANCSLSCRRGELKSFRHSHEFRLTCIKQKSRLGILGIAH